MGYGALTSRLWGYGAAGLGARGTAAQASAVMCQDIDRGAARALAVVRQILTTADAAQLRRRKDFLVINEVWCND